MNKTKLGFKNLCLPVFILFMGIGVQILISCSSDDGGSGSGASADGGGISQSSSSFGSSSYSSADGKQGDYSSSSGGDNQSNVSSSSSGGDIQSNGSSSSSGGEVSISSSIGSSSSSIGNVISSSSSEVSSFIYGSFTYEGQTYKTIAIGTQTWMAENLNYNASGSRCYKDDQSNCTEYGRLYSWATAMTVCPDGWHLPSDNEWNTLVNYAGGSSTAGAKLKARSGWDDWNGASGNGTDEYGFSALPGGVFSVRYSIFSEGGVNSVWWSATGSGTDLVYIHSMKSSGNNAGRGTNDKSLWFSVRCLQGGVSSSSSSSVSCDGYTSSYGSYGSLTYEGQTYKTVKIGNQTWMAENLNYSSHGGVCYDNKPDNCVKYGRLYTWAAAMDLMPKSGTFDDDCNLYPCKNRVKAKHRGLCPSGWHIPSNNDWDELFRFVDSENDEAGKIDDETDYGFYYYTVGKYLKATNCWNTYEGTSGNGTDKYGFSALPGGYRFEYSGSHIDDGKFFSVGYLGYWWSASENIGGSGYAYYPYMNYKEAAYWRWDILEKVNSFSVRCLQD